MKLHSRLWRAAKKFKNRSCKRRRESLPEDWKWLVSYDPVTIDTVCQFLPNRDLLGCMRINSHWSMLAWNQMDCTAKGPLGQEQYAIRWACKHDKRELLSRLLLRSDVKPHDGLRSAIFCSHQEIVGMLLNDERVDPADDKDFAIRWACATGQHTVVQLLLKFPAVDPLACGQEALNTACAFGHHKVVELLVQDWRVIQAGRSALMTAVHFARAFRQAHVLRVLISSVKLVDKIVSDA